MLAFGKKYEENTRQDIRRVKRDSNRLHPEYRSDAILEKRINDDKVKSD